MHKPTVSALFGCAAVACALALLPPTDAFAVDLTRLNHNFNVASARYEQAVADHERNAAEMQAAEQGIEAEQAKFESSKHLVGETMVAMYKDGRRVGDLVELIVHSSSIQDALSRYDSYLRIENYYASKLEDASARYAELEAERERLEQEERDARAAVEEARRTLDIAQAALLDAEHSKGADYHQVQGNGQNCGATAFIVAVNALLHDNRFTDNVEVWAGPGFERNSTINLAQRGRKWLEANNLDGKISIEDVPGDIHEASQLKGQLEQGNIVVISSGARSSWQRADGSDTGPGAFPGGHFIMFYNYENGVFFANDSSVTAAKGAGCPYTEEQLQAWLDGRSYHNAVALRLKDVEEDGDGTETTRQG